MKKTNISSNVLRLAQLAVLAAIAVVLVAFVSIPIIPVASFLKYDMADVPILIGTMLFGIWPGMAILVVTSAIQAFLFGGDGWVGMVMHVVASGALVVVVGWFHQKYHKTSKTILGMVLGVVAMVAVMIPMNLTLTVYFLGNTREMVMAMLLPAIIPFNLIKGALNCVISAVLFQAMQPFFKHNREMIRPV